MAHVGLALMSPGIFSYFKDRKEKVVKKEKPKSKKPALTMDILPEAPPKPQKPPEPKPKPEVKPETPPKKIAGQEQPKPQPIDQAKAQPAPEQKRPNLEKPVIEQGPKVVRTTDNQLQGEPVETNLTGERSTLAASTREPTSGAEDRAAIAGEESDFEETTDTNYQDGELEHMTDAGEPVEPSLQEPVPVEPTDSDQPAEPTEVAESTTPNEAQEPTESSEETAKSSEKSETQEDPDKEEVVEKSEKETADEAVAEVKSSVEESEERGEEFEAEEKKEAREATVQQDEVKEYLSTSNKALVAATDSSLQNDSKKKSDNPQDAIEEQIEKNTIANENVDPDGLKEKPVEQKVLKASQPKQKTASQIKPRTIKINGSIEGFKSQAKPSQDDGLISRRSKTGSQNVKATPLGRYKAKVSKLVEKEWQRRCSLKADLLNPEILRVSFLLDPSGKVIRTLQISDKTAYELNFSITFQAINKSKLLPPMPSDVRAIQKGEPLEFIYTFSF